MWLLLLLLTTPFLFSAPIDFVTPPAIYPINPAQRGADLMAAFQRLQRSPYSDKTTFEVSLTTTTNGKTSFVPFVNQMTMPTPPPRSANTTSFDTLLIIWFRERPGGDNSLNKYLVVPVEQITQMVYSQQAIVGSTIQTMVPVLGMIPYYTVDPYQRAFDIQCAIYTLNNLSPYNNNGQPPNVSLTTTLRGTYNGQVLQNGVIPFVREALPYGSMLLITYQLTQTNNIAQYIVASSEEVISINYLKN